MSWLKSFFKAKRPKEAKDLKKNNYTGEGPRHRNIDRWFIKKQQDKASPEDENRSQWACYFAVRHRTDGHICAWCKFAKTDEETGLTSCCKEGTLAATVLPYYYCKCFEKDVERAAEYLLRRKKYSQALWRKAQQK